MTFGFMSLFNEIIEVFGSISHDFCINDILSCHNARVQFIKLLENVRKNRITFVFLDIQKKVWFSQIRIYAAHSNKFFLRFSPHCM